MAGNAARLRGSVCGRRGHRSLRAARSGRDGDRGLPHDIARAPTLYVRYPLLRLAAGRGALWFFAFCAIWAGLAVALSQPPFSYSPERIGWYAVAGLLGVAATRIAGVWTDRIGARRVILVGLVLAVVSAVGLAAFLSIPL